MKGVIAIAMRDMVIDKFGREKWEEGLARAGINKEPMLLPISDIEDSVVLKIVSALCDVLHLSQEKLADEFGDYWVNIYSQKIYASYYMGCNNAKQFLLKMDNVHVITTKNMLGAHPPRFDYEWEDEKTLIMHYKSSRNLIDFLMGLIKGVGKFYGENLKVLKIGTDKVKIEFPY
ncbi:heme NO-binding domain-containing protein [candidate division WOR-3 bacterium]|uniref:Heme NO-binding domain-containing protein n=1 Tax=candidate division TA06 bacterium TaxID=2250710 RepID=A0A660SBF2_UNCT6|nr:heme NO-binding domain-containing protein [candidate division WOR-3 bacterium]RKX67042.1 MAG: hypothetical protein DRP44_02960 [candidate division TA06 bacterium]